ncbi:hypothetical protein IFM89_009619 [Coptis chinensis]|uniref:DUF4283 domain-containing protein n=1 Tax=Coptis chinensis TaxID=261450 RepID=A0A835IVI9_9MAGN|nr:hypothetical protein IFM89_009619 [Coptis chinensis]
MDLYEFECPFKGNTKGQDTPQSDQGTAMEKEPNATNMAVTKNNRKKISYTEAARQPIQQQLEVHEIPTPEKMGDYLAITIPEKAYEKGLLYCKFCLVGRIDLQKVSIEKVCEITKRIWKPSGEWLITPISKGYLFLRFSNVDDLNKVWAKGAWDFDKSPMRISQWTPNFCPDSQRQSHALMWFRFPGLGQEFWEPETFMSIARGIGYPMQIDENTLNREYGKLKGDMQTTRGKEKKEKEVMIDLAPVVDHPGEKPRRKRGRKQTQAGTSKQGEALWRPKSTERMAETLTQNRFENLEVEEVHNLEERGA